MSPGFQIWNLDLPTLEFRPSKFGKWPYGESPKLEGRISKLGRYKIQSWKPDNIEAPSPKLSNFIFQNDNFSGYIDLGDMRIDSPEVDLAAVVWSLQYNLGSGHGLNFLKKYGLKNATEELVEKLRLQYEDMQREWGLIEK